VNRKHRLERPLQTIRSAERVRHAGVAGEHRPGSQHDQRERHRRRRIVQRMAPAVALVVSGRVSFEIVQKAAAARVPVVVAVSAPTTLAIDLAKDAGIGLAAFVRGDAFNVYANAGRFDG